MDVVVSPINATNKNVEWMSYDDSIATVKNGKITAVGQGETQIIAKAMDSDDIKQIITVTVTDTVIKKKTQSLTLGEDIAVNFYITLNEGITDPVLHARINDNSYKAITGRLQSDGRYKFTFNVAFPQLTSVIDHYVTAKKDGEDVVSSQLTYSAREYSETAIKSDSPKATQELKDMAAKLLIFGSKAQTFFDYHIDDLADANLEQLGYSTELDSSVMDSSIEGYSTEYTGEKKAQFTTNSLVFENKFTLKYYMTLDSGVTNAYMAYRLRNEADAEYKYVPLTAEGKRYYAEIKNIAAPNLTDYYETFICVKTDEGYQQISDTKYYSPECYANIAYEKGSDTLKDTMVAMMMYCKSARVYFGL